MTASVVGLSSRKHVRHVVVPCLLRGCSVGVLSVLLVGGWTVVRVHACVEGCHLCDHLEVLVVVVKRRTKRVLR